MRRGHDQSAAAAARGLEQLLALDLAHQRQRAPRAAAPDLAQLQQALAGFAQTFARQYGAGRGIEFGARDRQILLDVPPFAPLQAPDQPAQRRARRVQRAQRQRTGQAQQSVDEGDRGAHADSGKAASVAALVPATMRCYHAVSRRLADAADAVRPVRRRSTPAPSARMIALIQRVSEARVEVDAATVGAIGPGLLALVAVEPGDGEAQVTRLLERLLGYRVFADDAGPHEPLACGHRRRPAAGQPVHARRRHPQGHAPRLRHRCAAGAGADAGSSVWSSWRARRIRGWKAGASVPI